MRVYAFHVQAIQSESKAEHVYMAVGDDEIDAGKKIVKCVEAKDNIKKGSIKFLHVCSISLEELAKELGPKIDKLVKETSVKSDLLEVIKRLSIG